MSKIEIQTFGNGTAIVSNYDPVNGEVVTLTCTPDTGELILDVVGWDSYGHSVAFGALTTQTFTWDDTWVSLTIQAVFTPKIEIIIDGHGTAIVDNYNPNTGDTVTLTCTPHPTCKIKNIYGLDEDGNIITFTNAPQQTFIWNYIHLVIYVEYIRKLKHHMPIWEYPRVKRC